MYSVSVAPKARRDIAEMVDWLAAHNPAVALRVALELQTIARDDLGSNPNLYAYFWLAGPPYRGRLFQISRHMKYWIVYTMDEEQRRVDILRVWNASRNPARFEA
ncbi:MAG: type II toxin-antitoxin system RelE/ParE family toxin [Beijerinckiaceae bacterium]